MIALALAGGALLAHADGGCVMNVALRDGDVAKFLLADKPVVTYNGDDMTVTSPTATFSYARKDVANITFDAAGYVADATDGKCQIAIDGRKLTVAGVSTVAVYGLDGCRVALKACGNGEAAVVDLDAVAAGVYVVALDDSKNFKILLK